METKVMFNRREAAAYLTSKGYPVAAATLASWAVYGKGPNFARLGRTPLYRRDELDRWSREQTAFEANSTAAHHCSSERSPR